MTPPSVANRPNSSCRNGGPGATAMCIRAIGQRHRREKSSQHQENCGQETVHHFRGHVFWYNITPSDGASPATAPKNAIYRY